MDLSPIFHVENRGCTKDFDVTDESPKFIIVLFFGYQSGGDSFTLSPEEGDLLDVRNNVSKSSFRKKMDYGRNAKIDTR